jgi:pimeloyl-ACP methyl ester carboxylesterase
MICRDFFLILYHNSFLLNMKNIFIVVLLFVVCDTFAQQATPITFIHDSLTVYGTFTTPAGNDPFTTIVIVPGSGPNDRDGTIQLIGGNSACLYPGLVGQTLKSYKDLSDALVDSGYAVLRYDKLEYTYGSNLGTITFNKLWLPVNSAIDYLKTLPAVDTNKIVLIGHSEGSTVIPYLANNRSDVAALISIAGPRTPLDSLLAYQLVYIAQTCNGDVAQAQAQANQILDYFNYVRQNITALPSLFGVSAVVWRDYIHVADSVSINYNIANLPTLFIGLEDDYNVPVSELMRFQNEIIIPADFYSLPGLNHFMTTATNPVVSSTLTDTVLFWLKQQGLTTSINSPLPNELNIKVYPNPTNDKFYVSGEVNNVRYNIFDLSGKIISSGLLTNSEISILHLKPGYYTLELWVNNKKNKFKLFKQN